MTKEKIQSRVSAIISEDKAFGLSVYAYLKSDNGFIVKPIVITSNLTGKLKTMVKELLTGGFLDADTEFDISDNAADNRKVYYIVEQSDDYRPFEIIDNEPSLEPRYTDGDKKNLVGLFFKLNLNDSCVWLYQHIYSLARLDRSKHIFAIFSGTTYDDIGKDLMQIDSRIDIVVVDGVIVTKKLDLLQQQFGFDSFIREGAKQTIRVIEEMDIVSGLEKFIAYEEKKKLTNAKKLLKARNSPVLKMEKNTLLVNIKNHQRYSHMFVIEGNRILISSQKDASAFIKMINDDYVRSELTLQEYDSSTKAILDPID